MKGYENLKYAAKKQGDNLYYSVGFLLCVNERFYKTDVLTDYLQELEEKLQYKHWYFGHYHMDLSIDDKHTLVYYRIIGLG